MIFFFFTKFQFYKNSKLFKKKKLISHFQFSFQRFGIRGKEGSSHPWQHRLQRYILEIIPATIYGLVCIRLWLPSWRSKPSSTKGLWGYIILLSQPSPQSSFGRIWAACKIIDAGYAMFHCPFYSFASETPTISLVYS